MTTAQANSTAVTADGLYVYGIARGDGHCVLGPIGLDGQMVYTVCGGGIRDGSRLHPGWFGSASMR